MNAEYETTRELREALLRDPHRPLYHIVAPEGVHAPFDPNGALYWNGRYHLMLLVQTPKGHCWAHLSSHDLVHWRHHPMALEPGGADACIFSGGAFVDRDGVPTLTYWGVDWNTRSPERKHVGVCLATSHDPDLDCWTKSPRNPVIRETGIGYVERADGTVHGASDPSAVWLHEGRYYLLTGSLQVLREFGLRRDLAGHRGDTAYLFVSDNLVDWEYLHPFYASDRRWTAEDEDNMCPDFFPLGDRHMLLFISHNRGCQYYIGRYDGLRFQPERHGRMSWVDNAYFAPESLVDDRGRRIMWAWLMDGRGEAARRASHWSGTLALPRVLSLGGDGTLRLAPPVELEQLRGQPWRHEGLRVPADGERVLREVQGDSLELCVEMSPGAAVQCGVVVRRSPDGAEQTRVYYDAGAGSLAVDTRASSLGEGCKAIEAGPLALEPGEPLRLRVYVDRSIIEVFANDRQAIARTVYPTRADSVGVALFSRGAPADVAAVQAWRMAPANPA